MEVPLRRHGSAVEVPIKCHLSANSDRPSLANSLIILSMLVQNRMFWQSQKKTDPPPPYPKQTKNPIKKSCMITGQYRKHVLQPEVSTTPAIGWFAIAQTDTLTNRRKWFSFSCT